MKAKRIPKSTRTLPGKLAKATSLKAKSAKKSRTADKGTKASDEKTLTKQRAEELNKLSLADLEKLHQSKAVGSEPVSAVVAKIKEGFASKQIPELKALCDEMNLKIGGAKPELVERLVNQEKEVLRSDMIKTLLTFEAKARADARAHELKVREIVNKIKKDLNMKSNQELKDICVAKGLKAGVSKSERVERLVGRAREDGEVEKALVAMAREERQNQLLAMDDQALMNLCTTRGVNPLVKAIMVDRLLLSESA
jgi:hypothetical protein